MPGIKINCCYCDRRVYKINSKVQPDGFEETYQVITNSGRICNGCYHRWRRGKMTQTDRGQRTQTDPETDDERDNSETEAEEEAKVENQNDKLNQAIASLFGRGRVSRGVRSRGSNIPNQSTQPTTSSKNGLRAQIVLIKTKKQKSSNNNNSSSNHNKKKLPRTNTESCPGAY